MQQLPRLIEKSYPQEDADCKLPRIILSKAGARVRILVKSETSENRQTSTRTPESSRSSIISPTIRSCLHPSLFNVLSQNFRTATMLE